MNTLTNRRLLYLKDFENYIQLFILTSSFLAMGNKHLLLESNNYPPNLNDCFEASAEPVRAVVSLGIVTAWFQLILVFGRYPFQGGDFSIMFYGAIKKIIKYVLAFIMIITGFSCSLAIIK